MNNNLSKEEILKKLGERIKFLRMKKGYSSYKYFAYEHNISRTIWKIINQGEDLRLRTLTRIVQAFDMTFEEFLLKDSLMKKSKIKIA